MASPDGELLADFLHEDELAAQLDVKPATLRNWEWRHTGPPVTKIGQARYYRIESVRDWLRSREKTAAA
jgi:DNA-binding transcriptional MerR regulator